MPEPERDDDLAEPPRSPARQPWPEVLAALRRTFAPRATRDEDVEDLVQETLARVLTHGEELEGVERAGAWIQRVAERVWIDARRRERPRGELELEVEPAASPGVDGLEAEVASWLGPFIEGLEPEQAEVLRRTELAGRPQREVADELGLSLTAVKSRVRRGRAELRRRLEACCRFEFDRRGSLLEVAPRRSPGTSPPRPPDGQGGGQADCGCASCD